MNPPIPATRAKHVLLTSWVCDEDRHIRGLSLHAMLGSLFRDAELYGSHIYREFYAEAAVGSTSPKHINRAIIRDLKVTSEGDVKNVTSALLKAIRFVRARPHETTYPMNTTLEREVLFATLSAFRTRLCMKDDWSFETCRDDFHMEFEYVM